MSATRDHVEIECARAFRAIPLISSIPRDGKAEIVSALLRNCQSDEHVTRVLRQFQETARDWHNPVAELVSIARETELHDQAPAGCSRCEIGEDTQTGEMRWAYHVRTRIKGEYTFSGRCSCPRGRWLFTQDQAREAEEREKRRVKVA